MGEPRAECPAHRCCHSGRGRAESLLRAGWDQAQPGQSGSRERCSGPWGQGGPRGPPMLPGREEGRRRPRAIPTRSHSPGTHRTAQDIAGGPIPTPRSWHDCSTSPVGVDRVWWGGLAGLVPRPVRGRRGSRQHKPTLPHALSPAAAPEEPLQRCRGFPTLPGREQDPKSRLPRCSGSVRLAAASCPGAGGWGRGCPCTAGV